MELRQLRYFVSVAETGSISRAAQKIFLTQPALSRQIKALEEELGELLLDRQAHSFRLTAAGEILLEEARGLLQRADLLAERVRAAGKEVRLRIGYAPSLASGLLSTAVESFVQKHRNAQVELFDLSSQELLAGLEAGTLDVVLTVAPKTSTQGLEWTPLLQLPWGLAVSRNHPLAGRKEVTTEEAARERLLVFCQRDYPEYRAILTNWLRDHHQSPFIATEYDGVSSLMAAVESGLGVAVVTTGSERLLPERVLLKPLPEGPEPLSIMVGYRPARSGSRSCEVFIEELRLAARTAQ